MTYVDDMRAPFGRLIMCHMVADSHEELLRMADTIKVNRRWIQKPGTYAEHFDICLNKRVLAVKHGAVQISQSELGMKLSQRRKAKGATA